MNEELYFPEKRVASWWQFIMVTRVTHMRVKISKKAIDRNWTMVPYVDLLDFIRLEQEDDYLFSFDYYKMKCSAKLEKMVLQLVDSNHPETRPDGDKWIEKYYEDGDGYITGDSDYKYYDLAKINIFNDTYTMWHSFSETKTEYFSIFFKEEVVQDRDYWILKVPMTPREIQAESQRQAGWKKYKY